jgi:2-hydroxy-4-carboxymuconate semialdehyde hemiacetal dehydrogenase
MNVVIFGAGAIAREHVRAIRLLQLEHGWQDLRLFGVYAPRLGAAAAFAAELGLPHGTSDPRLYLEDPGIDAVIVCSPSAMHVAQTQAALEAGKHVLCEIPLALSLGEAAALRDLADRQRRTLMVAHTLRFHPSLRLVRDEIANGRLHPTAIVARNLFLRRSNVGWTGYRRSWTDNLLWHHGGHVVDTCLWLLGADRADVAGYLGPAHPEQDSPLDVGLVLRTPDGVLTTIALSYNCHLSAHDYTVIGQERTLLASPNDVLLANGEPLPGIEHAVDPLCAQDEAFFTAIRTGKAAPVDVNVILPSLAVLQRVAGDAGVDVA